MKMSLCRRIIGKNCLSAFRRIVLSYSPSLMVCQDQHDCNEKLHQLTEEKHLLGFMEKQVGVFTTMTRTLTGSYEVDRITEEAIKLPTPCTETIIYKFK